MAVSLAEALQKLIERLAMPLIRLCVRHSLKLQDLIEVIKRVYVEAARDELRRSGATESASRISVMTGVHRPDVARILSSLPTRATAPQKDITAKVLGLWQAHSNFTTKEGKPRVLSCDTKNSEFASLVNSVSQAINPYTILFELERIGAVKKSPRGLRMINRSVTAPENVEQGLEMLADDSGDLFNAIEENLTETNPGNHHLKTEFDNVPDVVISEIRDYLLNEGARIHDKIRGYLSKYDRDLSDKSGKGRNRIAFVSFSKIDEVN